VWTLTGLGPATFWGRRRAHEAAVHLADAQLAAGREVDLAPEAVADGVDEWLTRIAASTAGTNDPARASAQDLRGDGQSLHFHATDPGPSGTGEWLVTRTPSGVTIARGHGKAGVAVRGPAVGLLLVLTRRLPPSAPGIEILGEHALLTTGSSTRRSDGLVAPRAPGHEPHDDENHHRDQPDDEECLERCEDPARSRDGKPDGEDRAENCPDFPAHGPSMPPGALGGGVVPAVSVRSGTCRPPGNAPVLVADAVRCHGCSHTGIGNEWTWL
jgi:hypothetical protein